MRIENNNFYSLLGIFIPNREPLHGGSREAEPHEQATRLQAGFACTFLFIASIDSQKRFIENLLQSGLPNPPFQDAHISPKHPLFNWYL